LSNIVSWAAVQQWFHLPQTQSEENQKDDHLENQKVQPIWPSCDQKYLLPLPQPQQRQQTLDQTPAHLAVGFLFALVVIYIVFF
jgi:hypothetical protein